MNSREMFLSVMAFEKQRQIPKWEYGYWAGVVRQWYESGLPHRTGIPDDLQGGEAVRAEVMGEKPGGFVDQDIHSFFHMDSGFKRIPVNNFVDPLFETEILEDYGDWILWRNSFGIIVRQKKDRSSLEAFVKSPVTNMEDWEMTIYQSIESLGGEACLQEIYEEILNHKDLTESALRITKWRERPAYHHIVRSYISNMCQSGKLHRTSRACYKITRYIAM